MNIKMFNSQFINLKEKSDQFHNLKLEVSGLINELLDKQKRNDNTYQENLKIITKKEEKIKLLSNNKYSTYNYFIDFLDDRDIKNKKGFDVHVKTGTLLKDVSTSTKTFVPYSISSSSDFKTYKFKFNGNLVSNELEYSFYSFDSTPLIPSRIEVKYLDNIENFYEPNFRFYNRNNSIDFVNVFPFTAKKIEEVSFYFEQQVDLKKSNVYLKNKSYSTKENDYLILDIPNPKKLKYLSLFKNSDESIVPLSFKYSENGIEFKDIAFDEYKVGMIELNDGVDFIIKISSNYDKIIKKSKTYRTSKRIKSAGIKIDSVSYKTGIMETVVDYSVMFSQTEYRKLEKEFVGNNLSIKDFIEEKDGIYYIKSNFCKKLGGNTTLNENLIFYDDFSILSKEESLFNIYLDPYKNFLYTSAFMDQYDFYFSITTEQIEEFADDKFYTPMLFDLSIKG